MFSTPIRNCLQYTMRTYLRYTNCTYTNSRDESNTVLPLVTQADSTFVRLHELVAKLSNWEIILAMLMVQFIKHVKNCSELVNLLKLCSSMNPSYVTDLHRTSS